MAKQKKQSKGAEESTPFDELLKRLADRCGVEWISYLGELQDVERCEAVGGEVEVTHRLTDRVFRVKARVAPQAESEEFLVHLEFESSYNIHMGHRLGTYGWGLGERENLPVMHLVWYVSEKAPSHWPMGEWYREREEEMWIGGRLVGLVCWREIWFPGKYDAAEFVKVAPAPLLPFAALMQGVERPFIKTLAGAIMRTDLSSDRKQDLLVMASFFLARFFGMQIVQEEIQMSLFEPNPFVEYYEQRGLQKGLEQGLEKGKQEGLEEGKQEGIEEGKQKARQVIVLRMVGRGMPSQLVAELTGLSLQEVLAIQEEHQHKQTKQQIARKMLERGFSVQEVSLATDLALSDIESLTSSEPSIEPDALP